MVKSIVLVLVSIAYTIFLATVSLININDIPDLGSDFDDKIYHFLAYFIFAFLWVSYFKVKLKNLWGIFFIMLFYGVVLELLQHKINPNRMYETSDLLANSLGVITGTLFVIKLNVLKLK